MYRGGVGLNRKSGCAVIDEWRSCGCLSVRRRNVRLAGSSLRLLLLLILLLSPLV